jgi:hypothetical protein
MLALLHLFAVHLPPCGVTLGMLDSHGLAGWASVANHNTRSLLSSGTLMGRGRCAGVQPSHNACGASNNPNMLLTSCS